MRPKLAWAVEVGIDILYNNPTKGDSPTGILL